MPAPDAPEDQQAHGQPLMTALPAGVSALASRDCLVSSASRFGVGVGGELFDGTGQSVPGLLDLVLNLLGGAFGHWGLLHTAVSQNLVLAPRF
jgi:hypothetical protein